MENTILQFTSSMFPTFETPEMNSTMEWPFQEGDTMFYDSLLTTDVEGNWDLESAYRQGSRRESDGLMLAHKPQ